MNILIYQKFFGKKEIILFILGNLLIQHRFPRKRLQKKKIALPIAIVETARKSNTKKARIQALRLVVQEIQAIAKNFKFGKFFITLNLYLALITFLIALLERLGLIKVDDRNIRDLCTVFFTMYILYQMYMVYQPLELLYLHLKILFLQIACVLENFVHVFLKIT